MDARSLKVAVSLGVTSLLTHATMRALRTALPASYPESVARYPAVVAAHPSLCAEVGQLANLQQDEKFGTIMGVLNDIVLLSTDRTKGNEFKIARASRDLERHLQGIVQATESWRSDDLFNEKRIALEDTVPTVRRHVEDILHNFIVDGH